MSFTRSYVSQLKTKGSKFDRVPHSQLSLDFTRYVKKTFPEFNVSEFLTSEAKSIPTRKTITPTLPNKQGNVTVLKRKFKNEPRGEIIRSLYNKLVIKIKPVREKLGEFFESAMLYLVIYLPYLLLIYISVQLYDFDIIDPVNNEDVDKPTYLETPLAQDDDSILKELKGGASSRSYVDNLSVNVNRVEDTASSSFIAEASTQAVDIMSKDAHSDIINRYAKAEDGLATPRKEKVNSIRQGDTVSVENQQAPNKNFHSLFTMLDFNNLKYSPSLFQSYTLPDLVGIKYKVIYNLDNI